MIKSIILLLIILSAVVLSIVDYFAKTESKRRVEVMFLLSSMVTVGEFLNGHYIVMGIWAVSSVLTYMRLRRMT